MPEMRKTAATGAAVKIESALLQLVGEPSRIQNYRDNHRTFV